jgi:hypothetical protein
MRGLGCLTTLMMLLVGAYSIAATSLLQDWLEPDDIFGDPDISLNIQVGKDISGTLTGTYAIDASGKFHATIKGE